MNAEDVDRILDKQDKGVPYPDEIGGDFLPPAWLVEQAEELGAVIIDDKHEHCAFCGAVIKKGTNCPCHYYF